MPVTGLPLWSRNWRKVIGRRMTKFLDMRKDARQIRIAVGHLVQGTALPLCICLSAVLKQWPIAAGYDRRFVRPLLKVFA